MRALAIIVVVMFSPLPSVSAADLTPSEDGSTAEAARNWLACFTGSRAAPNNDASLGGLDRTLGPEPPAGCAPPSPPADRQQHRHPPSPR